MTGHPIPDAALDADIAILGKKGRGKTYTAKGVVERLLQLQRRVLVLDPLSVWWGLRSSSDGSKPGFPIAVFGGPKADMPLVDTMGRGLAQVIGKNNLPMVLDMGEMTKAAWQRLVGDLFDELFAVNRDPLWIVLEEADVFAPQQPREGDSARVMGEVDRIARRGRAYGFRLISITQRPARLHKDVLTQLSTLVALGLTSPQDRDAIKAWVEGNADRDQAKAVMDSLAALPVGEGWVWAPDHDILRRVQFPPILTLDTSATPKAGEKRIEPKTLAEIDLTAISTALAQAAPEEKRARSSAAAPSPVAIQEAEQRSYERGFDEGLIEGERRGRISGIALGLTKARNALDALRVPEIEASAPPVAHPAPQPKPKTNGFRQPAQSQSLAADPLLNAALQVWPAKMTWAGLASMCGRKARGGHFNGVRKRLLGEGHVRMEGDLVVPTNPPETSAGVIPADLLEQNLPQPAAKMFVEIRRTPGISTQELADALAMKSHGGHWNGGMSILRRNGLITERDGLRLAEGLEAPDEARPA